MCECMFQLFTSHKPSCSDELEGVLHPQTMFHTREVMLQEQTFRDVVEFTPPLRRRTLTGERVWERKRGKERSLSRQTQGRCVGGHRVRGGVGSNLQCDSSLVKKH